MSLTTGKKAIDRLPFDVLGEIFSYYPNEETIEHPLETLLLVCKPWNFVALGHRQLWARIDVKVGHYPSGQFWRHHLPLRLARSGESTPLDIALRPGFSPAGAWPSFDEVEACRQLHNFECTCRASAQFTLLELVKIIAGDHGQTCRRWRHIHVDLQINCNYNWHRTHQGNYQHQLSELCIPSFCHPTPQLESITLAGVKDIRGRPNSRLLLPFAPNLESLSLLACQGVRLGDVNHVRRLNIEIGVSDGFGPLVFSNASSSTGGEPERTGTRWDEAEPSGACFPLPFPFLDSLTLTGFGTPKFLPDIRAPLLRRLTLVRDPDYILKKLVEDGLRLGHVEALKLVWDTDEPSQIECVEFGALILDNMPLLPRLEGDAMTVGVLMKSMWERARGTTRRVNTGRALDVFMTTLEGERRSCRLDGEVELEGAAQGLGLPALDTEWTTFAEKLMSITGDGYMHCGGQPLPFA